MVHIYFAVINEMLSPENWRKYIQLLPPEQREANNKYRQWQDRHAHLFGRLLLRKALIDQGFPDDVLCRLQKTAHGRPFVSEDIDFNISHSGAYVVCAVTDSGRVGVDVQQKERTITIDDFKMFFCENEWKNIHASHNMYDLFFQLWSRKESLIKADGRGMSLPVNQIDVLKNTVAVENKLWFIRNLDWDSHYACSIATSMPTTTVHYSCLDFYAGVMPG